MSRLTHDELREMKKRRSVSDLNRLLEWAEEEIGTPPLRTVELDAEGNLVESDASWAEDIRAALAEKVAAGELTSEQAEELARRNEAS